MPKLLDLIDSSSPEAVAKGIALVKVYATWCGPCKMLAPVFEQTAEVYPDVTFINAEAQNDCPELCNRYSVRSVPTLLLFKDGDLVARYDKTFNTTQKLQAWLDTQLEKLKSPEAA